MAVRFPVFPASILHWFSSQRQAGLVVGLSVALVGGVLLAGCRPKPQQIHDPTKKQTGRVIEKVLIPDAPPEYTNVVLNNGNEVLQSPHPVGKFGGNLYLSTIGEEPKTFNPWASYDATSSTVGGYMTSGLTDVDAYTGQYIPYLAKSIDIQPDNRTYVVTLRKGLQWSDGKPLTADDVVFTWNTILRHGLGNPSARDSILADGRFPVVQKWGSHTIMFRTAIPWAPFLGQLGSPIAPKHIFEPIIKKGHQEHNDHGNKAFSAAWTSEEASKHPDKFVSCGKWVLDRYYQGEQAVFRRNPHFFIVDKNQKALPYLDRIVLRFVKDQNNEALQFEQNKLDLYMVQGKMLQHVRHLHGIDFKLYDLGPSSGTTFLSFNQNPRKNPKTNEPYVDPIKAKWFQDQNFRAAVDWAVDRQVLINNILYGVGDPLFTAEGRDSIFVNEELASGHPKSLEKARELLQKSGFYWDKHNRLYDKDGHRVAFTLTTNSGNQDREATGVSVQQDLQELGMKVHFKPMDFNILVNKLVSSYDWEAVILALTGSNIEPHGGANVWKCQGSLHMFNQRPNASANNNQGRIHDCLPWEREMDRLMEKGAQTVGFENRKPIYDKFQELVYKVRPFIYLYSPRQIIAIRTRLQNASPTPLGGPLHNIESLWVESSPHE